MFYTAKHSKKEGEREREKKVRYRASKEFEFRKFHFYPLYNHYFSHYSAENTKTHQTQQQRHRISNRPRFYPKIIRQPVR